MKQPQDNLKLDVEFLQDDVEGLAADVIEINESLDEICDKTAKACDKINKNFDEFAEAHNKLQEQTDGHAELIEQLTDCIWNLNEAVGITTEILQKHEAKLERLRKRGIASGICIILLAVAWLITSLL